MKTKSNLARILDSGKFAVTAEISPPQNTEFDTIKKNIDLIKGYVDAFNVPDGQAAVVAMARKAKRARASTSTRIHSAQAKKPTKARTKGTME